MMSMRKTRNIFRSGFDRLRYYLAGQNTSDMSSRPDRDEPLADTLDSVHSNLSRSLVLLQQGNNKDAELCLRDILQAQADQPDALHYLGVLHAQRQELEKAAELIGRSLEIDPGNAGAHANLGNVFKALRRIDDALSCYDRALALNPASVEALNNRGAVLVELGRPLEALASYDRALVLVPGYVDAMMNRAVLFMDLARHQEALADIERVLLINPMYMLALRYRGLALTALGRHREALEAIEVAAAKNPLDFELLTIRGGVLAALGRVEEALGSHEAALSINEHYPAAALARCGILVHLKRFDDALAGYDKLLVENPDNLEALFNRGLLLIDLKRYACAVESYEKLLELSPDFVEAHYNKGLALSHIQKYEEALASCDRAISLRLDYADANFLRAVALTHLNRKTEALSSYDRVVAFNPRDAGAFNNRGMLLADMRRYDDALSSFDRALDVLPESVDALANRGGVFRALGLHERAAQDFERLTEINPEYPYALGNRVNSLLHTCNWQEQNTLQAQIHDAVRDGKRVSFPFSFLVMSDSESCQLLCAKTYAAHKYPTAKPLWSGVRYQHSKIRLAYLSADFHGHATSYLMVELFEKHDRQKFEVSAWSFGPEARDGMRKRLQQSFDQFLDVRQMTDLEVAVMLQEKEIDIAVDLKGYTRDSRTGIFSHRGAPIQVNYLVYPGTMGADYFDYIVADSVVIPDGHEKHYSEKVVRLPDTYQVNDSKRVISERTPSRAEAKLPESGFVFCCFNKNYKITPEIFDIWMRLLRKVKGSVLWLFEDNIAATRNLRAEAESRGVRADRLVFAAHTSLSDHLARHRLADLFLDTLPCNAHTTASDALWAGLPVLTCLGNTFPGRVAGSLLQAIGLPELITSSVAQYEEFALKLARTPELLTELRSRLAQNRNSCPLFNIDLSRKHIESAYVTMYERYQRGELPQGFSVPRIS